MRGNSMRKKYLIILVILLIIVSIIFVFISSPRIVIYINWKVYLPKPQKIDVIYNFEFNEGEDLEIWYYSKKRIEKIINNDIFKTVDERNKDFIRQKLNDYYEVLDDKEKSLFNANIYIDSLLVDGNYYIYSNKEYNNKTEMLLILDYENNKLYYFNNVY